jgi:hypothetical protein
VKDGEPVDWRYDLGEDVYRIEKNHPEIVFFLARDYACRDQIYHLTLRNTTVRTQTPL